MDRIDFTEPWDGSDIVFSVERKKIHASKGILSMWSPVMKTMFTADFKEKDATEIELPEKRFGAVLDLMKVLHPPNEEITVSTVEVLLPLAQEYQIDRLTNKCERFLLGLPASISRLVLAEEFNLPQLRQKCLDHAKGSKLKELRHGNFAKISSDTMRTIFSGVLEKSICYEEALYEIQDVVQGNDPEKKRFDRGYNNWKFRTFTCDDKQSSEKGLKAHSKGTEKACKSCSLYMLEKIAPKLDDLRLP